MCIAQTGKRLGNSNYELNKVLQFDDDEIQNQCAKSNEGYFKKSPSIDHKYYKMFDQQTNCPDMLPSIFPRLLVKRRITTAKCKSTYLKH